MYEPSMTLPERERLHYITNSPQHGLILAALEGDEEQQARISELEKENNDQETSISELTGKLEDAETELATAEEKLGDTIVELREQVEQLQTAVALL